MKVLHIGKFYHPVVGGMEDHLYSLCEELKSRVDLRVCVSHTKVRTARDFVGGVPVTRVARLGEIFSTSICPSFPLFLREWTPDIVHIHLPDPMAHISYLLADIPGKLVVMWHSDIVKQKVFLPLYRPLLFRLLGRSDRIITTSNNYLESSEFLRRFRDKCVVIPLGIDLRKYMLDDGIRKMADEIRTSYGDRIVLFVGRLNYYKGLDYMIEAMRRVEGVLLVVGTGKMERAWRRKVSERGLEKKVVFLGNVAHEDIAAYFHACDVFVLPSLERTEAFGVVQLEAMTCGKPVISTSLNTGVPWVNQHEKTGLVVRPKDAEALADAANRLLDDPALRLQYGANGRERVRREFKKEDVAVKVMQIYSALCPEL